jgi:hypothetical protein
MKVEWRNAGFAHGTAEDFMNFQVWLYGRSGIIEIRIGDGMVGSEMAFNGGPWLGTFMAVPTFTKALAKCWIYGDPAAPRLDSLKTLNFRRLESAPASGTVYRLVPSGGGASSVGIRSDDEGGGLDLTERR